MALLAASLADASLQDASVDCITPASWAFLYLSTLDLLLLAPPNCFLKLTSNNFEQLRNAITICYTLLHSLLTSLHCTLHNANYTLQIYKQWSFCQPVPAATRRDRLKAMLTLLYNSAEQPFYFDRSPLHKMQCLTLTPENSAHKTQHDHWMITEFSVHSLNSRII